MSTDSEIGNQEINENKTPTKRKSPVVMLRAKSVGGKDITAQIHVFIKNGDHDDDDHDDDHGSKVYLGKSDYIQIDSGRNYNPDNQSVLYAQDGIGAATISVEVDRGYVFGSSTRAEFVACDNVAQASVSVRANYISERVYELTYANVSGQESTVNVVIHVEVIGP